MKRPSLAESMMAVSGLPPVPIQAGKYHAGTRVGLKKVTTGLEPDVHKKLKRLAIDVERPVENLLREAIEDLLAKHAPTRLD
jgi:hypothetical protein